MVDSFPSSVGLAGSPGRWRLAWGEFWAGDTPLWLHGFDGIIQII
ncbi:hypothetical protein [Hydrogenophaga sp.]|jgi:hypothetical protein|nr:hypothetical protein [Hydrogenophaga sp.]